MKFNKKAVPIGLFIALALIGLWTLSTVWFVNTLAVTIIVLGLILLVRGLFRLWRWKKAVVIGLFAIFAALGLWAFFHEGTEPETFAVPTKPEPKFSTVSTAKLDSARKYPPYPEVWGYGNELTFPVPEDRRVSGVWKMDNGDYLFIYTKSEQIARKDGSCCDFRFVDESLQFFSGVRKDITRREIDQLRKKYRSLPYQTYQKLTFSDGSSIERGQSGNSATCYFPFHMVKKDKSGKIIARKSLLYLRVQRKKQPLNPDCEDSGRTGYFSQSVGEVGYSFLPLSDDTFIAYGGEGNFIRFDKDFNTRYRLNDQVFLVSAPIFLVDTPILEEFIKQSADEKWREKKLKGNVSNATIVDDLVGNHLRKQKRSEIDVPTQGVPTNQVFIKEVKAVRAKNKATQVSIHDLVGKYIPVGTRKEIALEFCRANGLKIYPIRDKRAFPNIDPKTYDEAISCSIDMTRWDLLWWFWAGNDTVLVVIRMKDGIVVVAGGVINFTSL